MSRYILDASIVVKWVISEPLQEAALTYLNKKLALIAPELLLIECASAIQKKVWRKELTCDEGWQAYKIIYAYEKITLIPTDNLIQHAFDLANHLLHPIYDYVYLALAVQQNAVVVTADKKFYSRIRNSSYSKNITWIEEPPILLSE